MLPTATAGDSAFSSANPHALAAILEASETRSIIASRDIFDLSGLKLWARRQPVSRELQHRLMDRQLREPLETCLMAEDGVTPATLVGAAKRVLGGRLGAWPLVAAPAATLLRETGTLPLHAVAQLLLTATQASQPGRFDHAVEAMLVNGALAAARRASTAELRLALLAGLLHDLGEVYIDPQHGEAATAAPGFDEYRELVVHPHVGRLLLEQLTDYPRSLATAVGEHHERLDGSGYPYRLQRDSLSAGGRQLSVTQALLGVLDRPGATPAHGVVALRVVPGEFEPGWIDVVSRTLGSATLGAPRSTPEEARQRLAVLAARLTAVEQQAARLAQAGATRALREVGRLSAALLQRLRTGWNASGLWAMEPTADDPARAEVETAEIEALEAELQGRLHLLRSAMQATVGEVGPGEQVSWAAYCAAFD